MSNTSGLPVLRGDGSDETAALQVALDAGYHLDDVLTQVVTRNADGSVRVHHAHPLRLTPPAERPAVCATCDTRLGTWNGQTFVADVPGATISTDDQGQLACGWHAGIAARARAQT